MSFFPKLIRLFSFWVCAMGVSPGCTSSLIAPDAGLTQSYYFFLKAQYDELQHRDDEAVAAMKKATLAAGGTYYLELETARMLARKGRLDEATQHVRKAIDISPQETEPRLFAGYLASVTGQWDEAEKNYIEALRLDPTSDEAISYLGAMYTESGRLDEASEAFRKLGAMTPTSYLPDYFLGRVAHKRGHTQEAIQHYQNSLRKKPDFVESLVELAVLYDQAGDFKNAEKIYRRIIHFQPDVMMAKARLSRILIKTGRKTEAIALIEEISGVPQTTESASITIGLMLLDDGLYQEATREFSGVLRKNPQNNQARYLLAMTQIAMGELKKAKENFQKLSPRSEEYVDGILYMAQVLSKENRSLEALELLSIGRRNRPSSPQLLVATGRVMEELEHLTQARDLYLDGLKAFPDSADIYFSLGVVQDRLGEKDLCVSAMERAVELDPEYAEALNYLAYTWAEENTNLKEARALAIKANNLRPDNWYFIDTLAWVYYRLNDLRKALPLLERAVLLSEEDPVTLEHLGDVLLKQGQRQEAVNAYQRALQRGHEKPDQVKEKLDGLTQKP
ncbi:MAG: tetratricopeptide repeat protein [Deltaproteobacteria bacterium]|jgi:tetratricopeptide (TPR) repeat protein|nr:tetratricopeptide repeat protein [Deltaproteobacteria bacterium]